VNDLDGGRRHERIGSARSDRRSPRIEAANRPVPLEENNGTARACRNVVGMADPNSGYVDDGAVHVCDDSHTAFQSPEV
jgi:hypothetical protein